MSIDINAAPSAGGPAVRKGIILFVLGITQLMIILDATIVNVAIDNIRVDLNVQSTGDLQWIVTGYALAFGGFLLLGGKLADRLGRFRRAERPWAFCSAACLLNTHLGNGCSS
jgi:MFS family permease